MRRATRPGSALTHVSMRSAGLEAQAEEGLSGGQPEPGSVVTDVSRSGWLGRAQVEVGPWGDGWNVVSISVSNTTNTSDALPMQVSFNLKQVRAHCVTVSLRFDGRMWEKGEVQRAQIEFLLRARRFPLLRTSANPRVAASPPSPPFSDSSTDGTARCPRTPAPADPLPPLVHFVVSVLRLTVV
eukprot:1189821-Prorocentrum_minimum.AAC.1